MYNSRCHKCLYYSYRFYMFDCGNDIRCSKIWKMINPNWYDRKQKCRYYKDKQMKRLERFNNPDTRENDLKKLLSIKGDFDARSTNNKT